MTCALTGTRWVWVSHPARFRDPLGRESTAVAPYRQVRGRHWWSCDRATRAGDLALLCPTDGDGAYLAEVLGDARVPRPWESSEWPTALVCDYVVTSRLTGLGPLLAAGRRWGGAFRVSDAEWGQLLDPA